MPLIRLSNIEIIFIGIPYKNDDDDDYDDANVLGENFYLCLT
jgi:hypothetical protein